MTSDALKRYAVSSWLIVLLLAGVVAITGCGPKKSDEQSAEAADQSAGANEQVSANEPDTDEELAAATSDEQAGVTPDQPERAEPKAFIETNRGAITIRLFINETPKTVENFVQLAKAGYFDGITWHRVVPHFVAQTGDPTGTGQDGKTYNGQPLPDEIDAVALGLDKTLVRDADPATRNRLQHELGPRFAQVQDKTLMEVYTGVFRYHYGRGLGKHRFAAGSVGMANAGAGTGKSQFFIVLENPQPHLDGRHTLFGEVTDGLDVAQKLQQGDKVIRITIIEP